MNSVTYINTETFQYPIYEYDIRQEFQDIGEIFVCPDKFKPVNTTAKPTITGYQKLEENAPVEIDGEWYQVWSVEENSMSPNDIIFSDILNSPVKAPQVETVWVDKKIYRTAYSRALPEGYQLYEELSSLFPDDMPVENRIDPNWIGKSLGNVREPYVNDTYSMYIWFKPLPETFNKFNVNVTTDMNIVNWYSLKFDSVTKEIMLKVSYYENTPSTPRPDGLPDGGIFGKIFKNDGTQDLNVDYYVQSDSQSMKEFCVNNNIEFPVPEEHLPHIVLYGIVYNIDSMEVSTVKGYDLRCPL